MGLVVSRTYPHITTVVPLQGAAGELLSVMLTAGLGASVYFVLTWILRVPEFQMVTTYIRRIASRRSSVKGG